MITIRQITVILCLVVTLGLVGCGTEDRDGLNSSKVVDDTQATAKEGDYEVSINVKQNGKNLDVYATITYLGPDNFRTIYHGGSIFFFNIYEVDGDFEYIGGMEQPLLSTVLNNGERHKVDFNGPVLSGLEPSTYEFEAVADISLDDDDMVGTRLEIPVSKVVEIN